MNSRDLKLRRWLMRAVISAAGLVACAGATVPAPVWPAHFHQIYLIDVSGSMKSSLGEPGSETRRFFGAKLLQPGDLIHEGDRTHLFSFSITGQARLHHRGPFQPARLRDILNGEIQLTHNNTDMVDALGVAVNAIRQEDQGRSTLIWILTDNINDPHGIGGEAEETQRFYRALFREDSPIQRMYFLPLRTQRLVLYVLICGQDQSLGGLDIEKLENSLSNVARGLGAPRIRAKPVGGENPIEIDRNVRFVGDSPDVSADVIGAGRQRELVIRGLKEGEPLRGRFELKVRSRFDEWRIVDAHIEITRLDNLDSPDFPNIGGGMVARLTPDRISIDSRGTTRLVYSLALGEADAPVPSASFFKPAALVPEATGVVTGRLIVKVGSPKLDLQIFNDEGTTAAVRTIFHLEDIGYFVPRAAAGKEMRLDFVQLVRFEVAYNTWLRWLALGGLLALLGATAIVLLMRGRKAIYCRLVGYQEDLIRLTGATPFAIAPEGRTLALLQKSLSGGVECKPSPGVRVNGKASAVALRHGAQVEIRTDDRTYAYAFEMAAGGAPADKPGPSAGNDYY